MVCEQYIHFDPQLRLLICKIHGFGIHPTPQAITRHLRGSVHKCRGQTLKRAVSILARLPLRSLEQLRRAHASVSSQALPSVCYLKVLQGWTCIPCNGKYLTTSIELVQRHAAAEHGRRRGEPPLWESCHLQTFFKETKDRQYFRVLVAGPADIGPVCVEQCSQLNGQESQASDAVSLNPANVRGYNQCRTLPVPASSLRARPKLFHPLTEVAKRHVPGISTSYLDELFHSNSFRSASEPLFDPSHIDAAFNMQGVFPNCDNEPLFYHALVYSMVQFAMRGKTTFKSLVLQKAVVNLLNERLSTSGSQLSPAIIGAILMLKTTAYKFEDHFTHHIHSQGLNAALKHCDTSAITARAKRALFWQDVYAGVFLDCGRQIDSAQIFDDCVWQRETPSDAIATESLPPGFVRCRHKLPTDLLDCVADLQEMKSHLPNLAKLPWHMRYYHLDSMQASIESRIVCQAHTCRGDGPFAEGVRLAVFLCCYCAWVEIWNDTLIPCKLAGDLLSALEPTLTADQFWQVWDGYLDVVLWLLLVVCSVVELDQGHVVGLKQRRHQALESVSIMLRLCPDWEVRTALHSTLQDFTYCDAWLSGRWRINDWRDLETRILGSAVETHSPE